MRYYVLRSGDPPKIRDEFVVENRDSWSAEDALALDKRPSRREGMPGAMDLFVGEKIHLRSELMGEPLHLEALRHWDRREG